MSAVWRAARAAVARRRLQTVVVGIVVALAASTMVAALGLVAVSSAPFDRTFGAQRGAHLMVRVDDTLVSRDQLAATADRAGVTAAAGPFDTAVVQEDGLAGLPPGKILVAGRADPEGPVDRLVLRQGRWARGPSEIVLAEHSAGRNFAALGATLPAPGLPSLTVVGVAASITRTADGWVVPEQVAGLGIRGRQMLYRLAGARTAAQVDAAATGIATGLPPSAIVQTSSYLRAKQALEQRAHTLVPFLMAFAILGLVVSVLVIANVVSGAVIAGYRHIGMLKALGFTPAQVVSVYLVMIAVPAGIGSLCGLALGNLIAAPLLSGISDAYGTTPHGVAAWVDAVVLAGVPAVAVLTALVPALRAGRLRASEAISAGTAPRTGRGLRVQRFLGRTRLPRAVSLGLGQPFARPARTGLTLAAIVVGATAITFAVGMQGFLLKFANAMSRPDAVQVEVYRDTEGGPADPAVESLLRTQPGTAHVTAEAREAGQLVGIAGDVEVIAFRGDSARLGYQLVRGRWFGAPGEAVAMSDLLEQTGKTVGDTLTVDVGGRRVSVRVVGSVIAESSRTIYTDWSTVSPVLPDLQAGKYQVGLVPGTDPDAWIAALDPQSRDLYANKREGALRILLTISLVVLGLTLIIGTVAACGVFNTVVLSVRERSRDLGVLKSLGMTPGQVLGMVVTSVAGIGVIGGLLGIPAGIAAHRIVIPLTAAAAGDVVPAAFLDVYPASTVLLLWLAGVVIAVAGALLPARRAARTQVASVLRNE